jgi:hypothetical protein
MLIKFTNNVQGLEGNPIYINSDWITAIYEQPNAEGGSVKTIIFGGPTAQAWEVAESLNEAVKILNAAISVKQCGCK